MSASIAKHPQRILVIREAAIGDVVCMTPFLRELRRKYPAAYIEYVVVSWARNIIETNPNVDKVHTIGDDGISGKVWKVALKRLYFYRKLAKHRYDLVFCPSTQLLYKLPLALFRRAYKVGFSAEPKGQVTKHNFMLDDYVWIDLNEIPRTRHIAVRYLEMLDLISDALTSRDGGLEVFLTKSDDAAIEKLLEKYGIEPSDELIAIAAAAGSAIKSDSAIKTAPPEKFIKTVEQLRKNNSKRKFFFIGSASEREYVEKMQVCDGKHIFNVCGLLSLRESAALLQRCRLLISNDSGVTHIASALKMNHIVLFGATDEVEFGPYQNPNAMVMRYSLPCAPCRKSQCEAPESEDTKEHQRPFCLSKIAVEDIVKAAEKKLSAVKSSIFL